MQPEMLTGFLADTSQNGELSDSSLDTHITQIGTGVKQQDLNIWFQEWEWGRHTR